MYKKVLLLEPYYTGSHKVWADNFVRLSNHEVKLLTMKGKHWKWRMQGAAIFLAAEYLKLDFEPDVIICSSMMDVSVFKALIGGFDKRQVELIYYLHESQFSYPVSSHDSRSEDFNYGFINYKSCLAADHVVFNSKYHQNEFFKHLSLLLHRLPDYKLLHNLEQLQLKSSVMPVGIEWSQISNCITEKRPSTLLWNHRWEHDKNPELFYKLVQYLSKAQLDFKLILLGKAGNQSDIKEKILRDHSSKVIIEGHQDSYLDYLKAIGSATILPVCSDHDYYGISVLEAIASKVYPILPADKIYDSYLKDRKHFYNSPKELFEKVEALLISQITFLPPGSIAEHDIYKVQKDFDIYISNLFNV